MLLALLAGCGQLRGLQQEVQEYEANLTTLQGTLHFDACKDCTLLLVAMDTEGRALGSSVFVGAGSFEAVVRRSARGVFAFHDANGNLQYDDGEAYAWRALPAGPTAEALTLELGNAAAPAVRPKGNLFAGTSQLQLGTVAGLDDARFDREKARDGMWKPMSFVRDGLAGIYFLQPYAANRTPVLLVHGMAGTPRDFAALVQGLDRNRFQPWVAYYPSGLDLDVVAVALQNMLNRLWLQHRFTELHVVAHSMGGLVTRSFIRECREAGECRYLRTFTSISSPFGGAAAAQKGVEHSPVVMPVWRDMSPKGSFVTDLFTQPLPVGVQHHLVFGYRDTTVPLASQLPLQAQRQAASVRGFDDDHMGILEDPLVAEHVNAILRGR